MRARLSSPPAPVLFFISGILMGSAFLHPYLWWALFPGLLLFLWELEKGISLKKIFFLGWLAGTAKMLVVIFFVWAVYPLTWAGIASPAAYMLIAACWLLVSAVIGLGYGIVSFVYVLLRTKSPHIALLLFPLALLLGEVCGALLYSALALGPGSGLTAALSFGHTGYVFANHTLLKWLARAGGVYMLTVVAGYVTILLRLFFKNFSTHPIVWKISGVGLITLFVFFGFFSPPASLQSGTNENAQKIAVFTTRFNSDILFSEDSLTQFTRRELVLKALKEVLKQNVSTIVLPESTRLSDLYQDPNDLLSFLKQKAGNGSVVLVDSVRTRFNGADVSRAQVYDTETDAIYRFDKQGLVALGEYIPYLFRPLVRFSPVSEQTRRAVQSMTFTPGIDQKSVELPKEVPNVLFCYGESAPWKVWRMTARRKGPGYVVHTVSDSWFTGWPRAFFHYQVENMLKIQALWGRTNIIQSSNMTASAYYKNDGTLGKLTPIYQSPYVRVDIAEL
jgi:apolipoprotein N-acyltransferase